MMRPATPLSRLPDYIPPHIQEQADAVFPGDITILDLPVFQRRAGMNDTELHRSVTMGLLRTHRKPGYKYVKLVVTKPSYIRHLKATATSLR